VTNVIKKFTDLIYEFSSARVFDQSRPLQPSIIFVGKGRSLLSTESPSRCSTFGWALALLVNIRLGRKLCQEQTLAYYEISSITEVKSFITLVPGRHPHRRPHHCRQLCPEKMVSLNLLFLECYCQCYKHFTVVIYDYNSRECKQCPL
jgi:hypothetical protein